MPDVSRAVVRCCTLPAFVLLVLAHTLPLNAQYDGVRLAFKADLSGGMLGIHSLDAARFAMEFTPRLQFRNREEGEIRTLWELTGPLTFTPVTLPALSDDPAVPYAFPGSDLNYSFMMMGSIGGSITFRYDTPFNPFVAAGAGLAWISGDVTMISGEGLFATRDVTAPFFFLSIGFQIQLGPRVTLHLKARGYVFYQGEAEVEDPDDTLLLVGEGAALGEAVMVGFGYRY